MAFGTYPFTLRQLQYIVAVAERGSFRKAAEICHVAQPSLSAQVAQVESALGLALFERRSRDVAVTPVGKTLVEKARGLLAAADDTVQVARGLADPETGIVRMGVIPTIGPYLLPTVAPVLHRRFPKLDVVWTEDKTPVLVRLLMRAEIDAAILALESGLDDLRTLELGKDRFTFAAAPSHPLAKSKRAISPSELAGEPVLLLNDGHCFRDQALSVCSKVGAAEAHYSATSLPTLVQMTAAGLGVTLLPQLALATECRRAKLAVRPIAGDEEYRTIVLGWRHGVAIATTIELVGEVLRRASAQVLTQIDSGRG